MQEALLASPNLEDSAAVFGSSSSEGRHSPLRYSVQTRPSPSTTAGLCAWRQSRRRPAGANLPTHGSILSTTAAYKAGKTATLPSCVPFHSTTPGQNVCRCRSSPPRSRPQSNSAPRFPQSFCSKRERKAGPQACTALCSGTCCQPAAVEHRTLRQAQLFRWHPD